MDTQPEEAVTSDVSEAPETPAAKTAEELAEELAGEFFPDEEEGEAQPEGEAEPEVNEEEGEPEETPAIEPPNSWKADAKEAFAKLPPELQQVVAQREAEREKFVQTKAQEAANTRQTVEREALQAIAQLQSAAAEQLKRYASQFDVDPPNPALLETGNPEHQALFYRQQAAYQHALAQRAQAQQEAEQRARLAEQAEAQALAAIQQQEQQLLKDQFPEWFDPADGPKRQQELQSIGLALGYSPEQMREARAVDILGLKTAAEWKAKADKWDAANKAKMETVRAAKNLPKVTRPGTAQSPSAAKSRQATAAWDEVKRTKSPDAFAAYLESSGIL